MKELQLLQLLLSKIDYVAKNGCLCDAVVALEKNDIICIREMKILQAYILSHPPTVKHNKQYYWPPFELTPRKEWIEKHIELLTKQMTKKFTADTVHGKITYTLEPKPNHCTSCKFFVATTTSHSCAYDVSIGDGLAEKCHCYQKKEVKS